MLPKNHIYHSQSAVSFISHKLCVSKLCMKQVEKMKQDDALSDMSDILVQLKEMAVDMGSEMDRFVSILYLPEKLGSFLQVKNKKTRCTLEIEMTCCAYYRQNVALDRASVDVEVLGDRVKDANRRGRRLLGK